LLSLRSLRLIRALYQVAMQITVHFYSYFKELAGGAEINVAMPETSTIDDLLEELCARFPRWAPMRNSTLIAVGMEYQGREYALTPGEEVSLFPPVQGG
jgi:molybdopterin converting factor small subunit